MRYRYFFNGKDKIIVVSSYAKKRVVGSATCSEGDEFNLEVGEALAKARCDSKIAHMRTKNALKKYELAQSKLAEAQKELFDMEEYYTSAYTEMRECDDLLENLLNTL